MGRKDVVWVGSVEYNNLSLLWDRRVFLTKQKPRQNLTQHHLILILIEPIRLLAGDVIY